jgi:hypothetical protein
MEDALAQLKAEEEKDEDSGSDKSQAKNEDTTQSQAGPASPKVEPADSPAQQGT